MSIVAFTKEMCWVYQYISLQQKWCNNINNKKANKNRILDIRVEQMANQVKTMLHR